MMLPRRGIVASSCPITWNEIERDLEDKACLACGIERCGISTEISEQLEYFLAMLKVFKYTRHEYACEKCDHDGYNQNIEAAKKPSQPIDRVCRARACWPTS